MKKKNKVILLILAILFILFVLYINYEAHYSTAERIGRTNVNNIKNIKKGMTIEEVISIMGKPNEISHPKYSIIYYEYYTHNESYPNATVSFDSTLKVNATYYPK